MTTYDNQFIQPTAGQADWDASLNADFTIAERGYHTTGQAGMAINTGHVLWQNSAGFFFHFNPNSAAIFPTHLSYLAAASGDSTQVLAWGAIRSLGILSHCVAGFPMFTAQDTPGMVVRSQQGSDRIVGWGLPGQGILFNPSKTYVRETLNSSLAINAVTGSLHLFTMEGGFYGWNRETVMIGNSANLVELKYFSESTRTTLLYSTISGGVSTVGSFQDRAGWPWEVTAIGSLMYGSLKIMSAAAVGSDTISVRAIWDRTR